MSNSGDLGRWSLFHKEIYFNLLVLIFELAGVDPVVWIQRRNNMSISIFRHKRHGALFIWCLAIQLVPQLVPQSVLAQSPDFGLFFFERPELRNNNGASMALVDLSPTQTKFFDPALPTVIYIHGMQCGDSGLANLGIVPRPRPLLRTYYNTLASNNKEHNVAFFDWKAFACREYDEYWMVEASVYGEESKHWSNPSVHKWVDSQRTPRDLPSNIYDKDAVELFIDDYRDLIGRYRAAGVNNPQIHIIGHSFGAHISVRFAFIWKVLSNISVVFGVDGPYPMPSKIDLLDPVVDGTLFGADSSLVDKNVVDLFISRLGILTKLDETSVRLFKTHLLRSTIMEDPAWKTEIDRYREMSQVSYDYYINERNHLSVVDWYFNRFVGYWNMNIPTCLKYSSIWRAEIVDPAVKGDYFFRLRNPVRGCIVPLPTSK